MGEAYARDINEERGKVRTNGQLIPLEAQVYSDPVGKVKVRCPVTLADALFQHFRNLGFHPVLGVETPDQLFQEIQVGATVDKAETVLGDYLSGKFNEPRLKSQIGACR